MGTVFILTGSLIGFVVAALLVGFGNAPLLVGLSIWIGSGPLSAFVYCLAFPIARLRRRRNGRRLSHASSEKRGQVVWDT
ncbi:MAG: hypothetical protein ACU0B9_07470 [Limimaricola soesokkakensis]|uniref:hypothetical protein n=1 Tax=Limimaricola soesokkakensis TaxID=1343159 RepID=UPI0040590918